MKPMASYLKSPWKRAFDNAISMIAILLLIFAFLSIIAYLPEYFDARDGYHEGRTIYGFTGIRG
jgi:hypothetical protein